MVEQKPLGVIDVLTAGFEIVRKRPWTMLVPVLLDPKGRYGARGCRTAPDVPAFCRELVSAPVAA